MKLNTSILSLCLIVSIPGFAQTTEPNTRPLPSPKNINFTTLKLQAENDRDALDLVIQQLGASTNPNDLCELNTKLTERKYIQWFIQHSQEIESKTYESKNAKENLLSTLKTKIEKIKSIDVSVIATSEQNSQSALVFKNLRRDADQNIRLDVPTLVNYFVLYNSRVKNCPKDQVEKEKLVAIISQSFSNPIANPFGITLDQATIAVKKIQTALSASLKDEKYNYKLNFISPANMICEYGLTLEVSPIDGSSELGRLKIDLTQKLLSSSGASELDHYFDLSSDFTSLVENNTRLNVPENEDYAVDAYERYFEMLESNTMSGCNYTQRKYGFSNLPYVSPNLINLITLYSLEHPTGPRVGDYVTLDPKKLSDHWWGQDVVVILKLNQSKVTLRNSRKNNSEGEFKKSDVIIIENTRRSLAGLYVGEQVQLNLSLAPDHWWKNDIATIVSINKNTGYITLKNTSKNAEGDFPYQFIRTQ